MIDDIACGRFLATKPKDLSAASLKKEIIETASFAL